MYEDSTGCALTDQSMVQLLSDNGVKVDDVSKCAFNSEGRQVSVVAATTSLN